MTAPGAASPRLGLAANWRQFSVLMLVNAFVGAMVGLERTILPALAEQATGSIAASHGLRPWPFSLGIGFVLAGLLLSIFAVRETHDHARHEALGAPAGQAGGLSQAQVFARTSLLDRDLSAISQAGVVNNRNDSVA